MHCKIMVNHTYSLKNIENSILHVYLTGMKPEPIDKTLSEPKQRVFIQLLFPRIINQIPLAFSVRNSLPDSFKIFGGLKQRDVLC